MAVIALIENEALVALDISRSLKVRGHTVLGPFCDPAKCLEETAHAGTDLLLLDISIDGKISAIDAARLARSGRGLPSVFMTSSGSASLLSDSKDAEPLGILVKPFSERELLGTIDIALFRARLEKALRESERRYHDLFDFSLSARCVLGRDGRILETNAAFRELFRTGPAMPFIQEMVAGEYDREEMLRAMGSGSDMRSREIAMKDMAGKALKVHCAMSAIPDLGNGGVTAAEFLDLTESDRLREQLFQAQKMEAMGRLASSVAHDFNNILTVIIGHSEMMKLEMDPNDAASAEDLEGIRASTERATQLTRQLLGFSRRQPYSPRALDMCEVIRNSSKMLKRLVGEAALFSIFLPEGELPAFGDPAQIEQALINLVVNARDALGEKTDARISIYVEKKYCRFDGTSNPRAPKSGNYIVVEVSDNGPGISDEKVDKIFDPFFTTKGMGKGTGLGLSIVKSIMNRAGGAISVETRLDHGSAFSLWFPMREFSGTDKDRRAEETVSAAPEIDGESLPDSLRVLLVDDDEALLGLLARAIAKAGAFVIAARNPGEALLCAEKQEFDMLVTDYLLPGIDGRELLGRLGKGRKLQGILISGMPPGEIRLPDNISLMQKPFAPKDLIARIRAVASQARI